MRTRQIARKHRLENSERPPGFGRVQDLSPSRVKGELRRSPPPGGRDAAPNSRRQR